MFVRSRLRPPVQRLDYLRNIGTRWNPTIIVSDNRIPARATDVSVYEFQAPPSGTTVNVEGRLIFRRAFKALMEAQGWDTPDILMGVETASFIVP